MGKAFKSMNVQIAKNPLPSANDKIVGAADDDKMQLKFVKYKSQIKGRFGVEEEEEERKGDPYADPYKAKKNKFYGDN